MFKTGDAGPRPHKQLLIQTMEDVEAFWDGSTLDEREAYGLKQAMTGHELEKWFTQIPKKSQKLALKTLMGQTVNWTE